MLHLIDRLDRLLAEAGGVPLTDQVRVDREAVYGMLDEIRAVLPEEIRQARWIVKERQEMLAEAQRERDRLVGEARERAALEHSEARVTALAERQADELLRDARRRAHALRVEVDEWADAILGTLEANLQRFSDAVRRGRERLLERSSKEAPQSDAVLDDAA